MEQTDYVVKTPDRRKPYQLCHINILKPYHRYPGSPDIILLVSGEVAAKDDSGEVTDIGEWFEWGRVTTSSRIFIFVS